MEPVEARVRRVLAGLLTEPTPPHPDSDDLEELAAWIEAERSYVLARGIADLDERDQAVLVLHYFENLDVAEVARLLEAPAEKVRMTLYRARETVSRDSGVHDLLNQIREKRRRDGGPVRAGTRFAREPRR